MGTACARPQRATQDTRPAGIVSGNDTSGKASDLSSFGGTPPLDCVVAVSQAAIGAGMWNFFKKNGRDFQLDMCFVLSSTGQLVEMEYKELKDTAGVDPFTIADGSTYADGGVAALDKVRFVGALKFKGGVPRLDPAHPVLPPIVLLKDFKSRTLDLAFVAAEVSMCGLIVSGPEQARFLCKSQLSSPWAFKASVNVVDRATDAQTDQTLPDAVKRRSDGLRDAMGSDAFSLRKLLLDLETAQWYAPPVISGLSDVHEFRVLYEKMCNIITSAYVQHLLAKGEPCLSYQFTSTTSPPATMTLTALSVSTEPFIVNGRADWTNQAACLTYLATSAEGSSSGPAPVAFPWNWVLPGDIGSIAGVVSTRRAAFIGYLQRVLNEQAKSFCLSSSVRVVETSDTSEVYFNYCTAADPSVFITTPIPSSLVLSFLSQGQAQDEDGLAKTTAFIKSHAEANVQLSFPGSQFVVSVRTYNELSILHTNLWGTNDILKSMTYYDKTYTATFTIAVSSFGELQLSVSTDVQDNCRDLQWGDDASRATFDKTRTAVKEYQDNFVKAMDSSLGGFGDAIKCKVNASQAWVFPGSESFAYHNAFFSESGDLVSQVNYSGGAFETANPLTPAAGHV